MTAGCADHLFRLLPLGRSTERHAAAAPTAGAGLAERSYFRIGPVELELHSNMSDVAVDFAALYRGWRRPEPDAERLIRLSIEVDRRTPWGARRYAVTGDGERIFSRLRPEEVLPYLEWGINYRVIATHREYLQLHAATLAWRGNGVMLVGPSGCGKSTLTAALAARGWSYLSDEFALIEPETLLLHAFPKALCIKAGSFELVRRLNLPLWSRRPYVKAFKGRVAYVSPHDVRAEAAPVPIRLIAFPRYTGGRTSLYPCARARAAFSLTANTFNPHVYGDRLISLLGEVVRGARCVALEPGNLEETCARLEALVSGRRVQAE